MQALEGVRLALQQLRQERLKSAFSLLGVVIGVMFLLVVISVVEGMDRYIQEDFAEALFGVNTVQVVRAPSVQVNTSTEQARAWGRRPAPTVAEAEALRERLSTPTRVGVESTRMLEVSTESGRTAQGVRVSAISEEVLEIRSLRVEEGRPFSAQEAARGIPVTVLGSSVAEGLFPEGDAVGNRVLVRGFPYRVVGVLEDQGTVLGVPLNNQVLVPALSRAGNLLPVRGAVSTILIQTEDRADLPAVMAETEAILRTLRRLRPSDENDFTLQTAEDSLAFWDRINLVLLVALPGLVGISLVVGGIVIMNIMLVSVMERTREIGIRKALGARRRDIVGQFLIEATTLSLVGAVVGVLLGIGLAAAVRTFTPLPAAVAPGWVALSVVLGLGVGVSAGVYPALRASALDPVEALRHE